MQNVDDDFHMYDGGDTMDQMDVAAATSATKAAFDHKNTDPACCDDEDHCCKCIPLTLGIKLLGVWVIISTILMILGGLHVIDASALWGIISLAMCVGPAFCSFRFFQWFRA